MHNAERTNGPRWIAFAVAALVATSTGQGAMAQDATPPAPGDSEITTQLPAVDLPTMNEQGFVFELESSWNGSFDEVPLEAPVFQLNARLFDQAAVEELAGQLGIEGEVEDQGSGTFSVSADNGNLFVTPGLEQYVSNAEIPEGELPDDEQAVAFAREWLRQTQLLPADAGTGTVLVRVDEPARVIVNIEPIRPENLLSAYPAISVTMGPGASILEASFRWPEMEVGDIYSLRPVDSAWTEVAERRSYLQADVPGDVAEPGETVTGRAVYDEVVIAYAISGIPGETQFLQPVYMFTGTLVLEGSDAPFPIMAFVPALVNSQQPVG